MNAAKELASIYGENVEEAEIAGLIHDVAKELRKDEIEEYLERYNIKPDEIEQIQIGLLHAKLGAVIARDEFNLSREIQKAIEYHTTGNKNMDNFAKIIYLATHLKTHEKSDQSHCNCHLPRAENTEQTCGASAVSWHADHLKVLC